MHSEIVIKIRFLNLNTVAAFNCFHQNLAPKTCVDMYNLINDRDINFKFIVFGSYSTYKSFLCGSMRFSLMFNLKKVL